MEEEKIWKEVTKLNNKTKLMITLYIIIAIYNLITAAVVKNIAFLICGFLWLTIAIQEYCYRKTINGDLAIIELYEKDGNIKEQIIKELLNKTKIEIPIDKIIIPDYFTKPNKIKLKNKIEYFKENNKFETPITINSEYVLVDGYTSYLIAKKIKMKNVEVKIDIKSID